MRNSVRKASNKNPNHATIFGLAETGEEVHLEAKVARAKYYFPGGWRALGVFEVMRILKADMTDTERIVAFWLPAIAEKADGPNHVKLTGKRAMQELGISKYSLSRAVSKLKALGLLRETGIRGLYQLNPEYSFHGSAEMHAIAKRQWYSILDGKPALVFKEDQVA